MNAYRLLPSDLKLGQCWRTLPHGDASVDAVVFDPPYMEGLYRKTTEALAGSGTHRAFQEAYSNGGCKQQIPDASIMTQCLRLTCPSCQR